MVVIEGGSGVADVVVTAGLPPQAVATSKNSAPIKKSAPGNPLVEIDLIVLNISYPVYSSSSVSSPARSFRAFSIMGAAI